MYRSKAFVISLSELRKKYLQKQNPHGTIPNLQKFLCFLSLKISQYWKRFIFRTISQQIIMCAVYRESSHELSNVKKTALLVKIKKINDRATSSVSEAFYTSYSNRLWQTKYCSKNVNEVLGKVIIIIFGVLSSCETDFVTFILCYNNC